MLDHGDCADDENDDNDDANDDDGEIDFYSSILFRFKSNMYVFMRYMSIL